MHLRINDTIYHVDTIKTITYSETNKFNLYYIDREYKDFDSFNRNVHALGQICILFFEEYDLTPITGMCCFIDYGQLMYDWEHNRYSLKNLCIIDPKDCVRQEVYNKIHENLLAKMINEEEPKSFD